MNKTASLANKNPIKIMLPLFSKLSGQNKPEKNSIMKATVNRNPKEILNPSFMSASPSKANIKVFAIITPVVTAQLKQEYALNTSPTKMFKMRMAPPIPNIDFDMI